MTIIQNYQDLATSQKRKECLDILESGLQAATPENIIPFFVSPKRITVDKQNYHLDNFSGIYTIAFGKAADSMTRSVNDIIALKNGIIVIPKGSRSVVKGKKFKVFNSGHPTPDKTSVKASKEVIKFLENRRSKELVIFLVSGGGSSLLALPDSITLDDKIYVTSLLLKSGANIQEINCIRKHISMIKGGRLLENIKCSGIGLVMSDVENNDLSSIASGTTHFDRSTFQDAMSIIIKYKLKNKIPKEVLHRIEKGVEGKIAETPKKAKISNHIIAANTDCLFAMEQKARDLGYPVKSIELFGDIKNATKKILENIPKIKNSVLIFGGETTVQVRGKGSGGRNQELVLRILKNTQNQKNITISALGTDGIDGNSLFAGAISENFKVDLVKIKTYLKNNDSARFFQKYKSNIKTGITHTNLMDIGVIVT